MTSRNLSEAEGRNPRIPAPPTPAEAEGYTSYIGRNAMDGLKQSEAAARKAELRYTPSYIQVCAGLRLPREFQPGDWYAYCMYSNPKPLLWCLDWAQAGPVDTNEQTCSGPATWLPSLADWLELLEKALYSRAQSVVISHYDTAVESGYAAEWMDETGRFNNYVYHDSPEEAAAGLWVMATTPPAKPKRKRREAHRV